MRPAERPRQPAVGSADRWTWVDLRLLPLAGAVWAATIGAGYVSTTALTATAGTAGLAAALLLSRRCARTGVVVAVVAGVAVTTATAAGRAAARESSPLWALAESGSAAVVVLEVRADPRPIGPGRTRVVADATVTAVLSGGTVRQVAGPVLLFAPTEQWRELLPGRPVQASVRASLPRQGDHIFAVLSARGPPAPVGPPGPIFELAGDVRASFVASAARVLGPRPAGLLPGLVVGDIGAMDPVLAEEFRRAGLAHLTAVSGANVAIALAAVLWPLRRRAVDRRVQAALAALALAGFVVLAQPTASVLRAAAMGAVGLLALVSGRSRAAVPALAATVVVLLLLDPALGTDGGFALSVTATGAIVLLASGWSRSLRRSGWPTPVAEALAVTAAAGCATAPLLAGLTGTVSLVSLPANLLAAPAVPAATVLGLAAAALGPLAPPAADALVWLAGWPVRWLVLVAEVAAGLPDAATQWPAGTAGALLLTALLVASVWALWRSPRLRLVAVAALVGVVVVGWPVRQVVRGWPPPDTVVVACDVGQGDALVIPTGAGAAVLVDAGPDVGPVDACLDRLGVRTLPLVLLSHLDADHVGGLAGALSGRAVGVVATGSLSPADHRMAEVRSAVRRAGGRHAVLVPGDRRSVGGAVLEVLAPEPARATPTAAANDLSLVVRLTYRGLRLLLTGDLGAEAEQVLLRSGHDLRADVLKVPHHGSADVEPRFLAATGARVALISVGAENTYGHPAPRLLRLLARGGMRVHRTDREGDLAIVGTSRSWGVAGSRSRAVRGPGAPGSAPAADRLLAPRARRVP